MKSTELVFVGVFKNLVDPSRGRMEFDLCFELCCYLFSEFYAFWDLALGNGPVYVFNPHGQTRGQ
jgi:hypothetical protein